MAPAWQIAPEQLAIRESTHQLLNQMNHRLQLLIAVLAITTPTFTVSGQGEPTTLPSLGSAMLAIVEVDASRTSHLPELAAVIAAPAGDIRARDLAIDRLVEVLCGGGSPTEFRDLLVSNCTVIDSHSFQHQLKWKYGTFADRRNLAMLMMDRARLMQRESPERAARYAKASLLLSAYEDFVFGDVILGGLNRNVDEVAKLAQLTPNAAESFKRLLGGLTDRASSSGRATRDFIYAEATILKYPNGMPPGPVDTAMAALEVWWKAANEGPTQAVGEQATVITNAWLFRNLAHARENAAVVSAVDAMLDRWKTEPVAPLLLRWIDDARVVGPPLTSPRLIGPGVDKK